MPETPAHHKKDPFLRSLKRSGKFMDFVARRQELVSGGMTEPDADAKARVEFKPTRGPKPKAVPMSEAPTVVQRLAEAVGILPEAKQPKPRVDAREVVQWVFENLANADVTPDDAPSWGAWALLESCINDKQFKGRFLLDVWTKLLPSKSQIESTERFTDSGQDIKDLIDRVERISEEAKDE